MLINNKKNDSCDIEAWKMLTSAYITVINYVLKSIKLQNSYFKL